VTTYENAYANQEPPDLERLSEIVVTGTRSMAAMVTIGLPESSQRSGLQQWIQLLYETASRDYDLTPEVAKQYIDTNLYWTGTRLARNSQLDQPYWQRLVFLLDLEDQKEWAPIGLAEAVDRSKRQRENPAPQGYVFLNSSGDTEEFFEQLRPQANLSGIVSLKDYEEIPRVGQTFQEGTVREVDVDYDLNGVGQWKVILQSSVSESIFLGLENPTLGNMQWERTAIRRASGVAPIWEANYTRTPDPRQTVPWITAQVNPQKTVRVDQEEFEEFQRWKAAQKAAEEFQPHRPKRALNLEDE
jgi:hypothetical protein